MDTPTADPRTPWLNFRTIWRWHFYAGLFCIPFIWWLALTGSIYLFKPQLEAWLDRPYAHLAPAGARATPQAEVEAALAAEPGYVLDAYQLPREPGDAAQILVGRGSDEIRLWIDPRLPTPRVLKAVPEDERLMQVIFHLHGELLLGDRGSMIVELAGSWAMVMIITGLYLWWPRDAQGFAGVLYPRLGRGRRVFWRDIHAVAGIWVSVTALLMLASGLPWAKSWGGDLKEIRHLAEHGVVHQDWSTGLSSELAQRAALSAGSLAGASRRAPEESTGTSGTAGVSGMAGMSDMPGMSAGRGSPGHLSNGHRSGHRSRSQRAVPPGAYSEIDRMVPVVAKLGLAYPVLITPPMEPGGPWGARSDAQDRPLRVNLTLNAQTGAVLSRTGFNQRDWVDRVVSVGIAAHEGQLFGWPNQLMNLLTASGLFTASLSAVILWWRRRPQGVLGAPLPTAPLRFSAGLLAILLVLGVLLPLLGASLIAVLLVERLVFRRVPGIRTWLGLREPAPLQKIAP